MDATICSGGSAYAEEALGPEAAFVTPGIRPADSAVPTRSAC